METAISDGKVDGNNISFAVKREFNGNSFVTTYKGTLDGEQLENRNQQALAAMAHPDHQRRRQARHHLKPAASDSRPSISEP